MSKAQSTRSGTRIALLDRFGATSSLLCALHCAFWPLAIAALPTLGLGLLAEVGFEQAFTVFATVLALATLGSSWRRHRNFGAVMFLVPGLLALWLGAFGVLGHENVLHAVVMAVGGTLIAAAHVLNIRLGHGHLQDACCGHHDHQHHA